MSWWTNVRDAAEGVLTGGIAGLWNKGVSDFEGAAFNKVTGRPSSDEKRNQQYAMNDQVKAYQDQTALAKQQLDEARNATTAEKRRVEEKQIRSLRRNYRTQSVGMLGVGSPDTSDMNQKLGG